MNPKYQKVLSDIEKAEKKKSEIEGQLKELYDKKTELENLEIILSLIHIYAFSDTSTGSGCKGRGLELDKVGGNLS